MQGGIDISLGDSCYFGGDALQCAIDQNVSAFGGPGLLGVLVGAVIFAVFYIASDGEMATPTVALVLTGTVIVGMMPASYQSMAYGVVVIGLAAAVWQVFKQYVLSGSVVR